MSDYISLSLMIQLICRRLILRKDTQGLKYDPVKVTKTPQHAIKQALTLRQIRT